MSHYEFHSRKAEKAVSPPPMNSGARLARGCGRVVLLLLQLTLLGGLVGIILAGGGYIYLSNQLKGAIDQVVAYQGQGPGGTPRFYDRNGLLLFELTVVEKRRWLAYNEIPESIKLATVAVEDDSFWTNPGFDPAAIAAALLRNSQTPDGRPVGASTITQQLVRHIAFSYEERVGVSYERKAKEIFLSFILTQQRSKEDILQMYLNEIYYGNLAYGIEAAAQTYLGKSATHLTLGEAAFLAGLPQSPILYDPYINFDTAKERQAFILDLMVLDGTITQLDAEVAKAEAIILAPLIPSETEASSKTLEAAHFVLYIQNFLEQRYGPDALIKGGWQITTSLDLNIQHFAEQAAREWVALHAQPHDVNNASVVVMKPGTGEILAMVGSLNYFDEAIDGQVNVALMPRQPGSSFKPITYAAAMENGWTTGDVLWDVPIKIDMGGGELMQPRNYSGTFHGPVLFRDALANSYNIPPIQLMRDVGISTVIAAAHRMGVDSLQEQPGFYGLALTLGGGEVPLLEMTHAYATLANQGQKPMLTGVLKIVDGRGNVVYDSQREQFLATNALDPRIAYIITNILDDDRARLPAFGAGNPLALPFPAAAKTGTTNDFRDDWTIGYTPGVVVGVWVGNTDGHPMQILSGVTGAAPLWRVIMERINTTPEMQTSLMVNGQAPPLDFPAPANIEQKQVCLPQGTGGTTCTAWRTDLFLVSGPYHGVNRLGYVPDATSNPGAWTVMVLPLTDPSAVMVNMPPLDDGTQAPTPTYCVLNSATPPASAQIRLFLPVPPFYPDEVRARRWASGSGYQMAPPVSCPVDVIRAAGGGSSGVSNNGNGGSGGSSGASSVPAPVGTSYFISSPGAGAQVNGLVNIMGTASFNGAEVQYYKLEIGSGSSPSEWTTFGSTHSTPVNNGVLEQLHADALPAGDYVIRLVLVQADGNYSNPYNVPIKIGP
ncbi:MAG: penicillin-binding protein [Chloroflexi bacterium]|nr:penicillin-binding protein [Chloroflexota bacterium]MBP8058980.1 penicillin-binding protein [Chloroflexota bacterium]